MKKKLISAFILLACGTQSFAAILLKPEKETHLFETFGLFSEDGQTALYCRGGNNYWGEIGGKIALLNVDSIWGKPQFVFNVDLQVSMRKEGKEFLSDTQDVRLGVAGLFTINPFTRMAVSFSHLSGHVLEDIEDKDLIPVNVGDDSLQVRIIHDFEKKFRFGGTLKYILGSQSTIKNVNADQFLEWFPLSERSSQHLGTPYLAAGLEENGFDKYVLGTHLQTGVYWGNHLDAKHDDIIRVSLGAYNGMDPRQKYAHFKKNRAHFGYLGLAYEY